ncbi:UNVERIFIED_CONTAM: hypothetical protein FKN15_055671 [Acipenser sinensis]
MLQCENPLSCWFACLPSDHLQYVNQRKTAASGPAVSKTGTAVPAARGDVQAKLLASVHHRHLGAYCCSDRLLTTVQAPSPTLSGVTATSVTDPQDAAVVSQEVAALLQKQAIRMIEPFQLGLMVNHTKSQLIPSQTAYLGVFLDSRAMLATLSDGRVHRIAACLELFQFNRALMLL